jgi:hypothetical protein
MGVTSSTPDKNNIFPSAKKVDKKFYKDQLKIINAGKSKFANYVLKHIDEYSKCGNIPKIDIYNIESTEAERAAVKRLLKDKGWGIRVATKTYKNAAEFENEEVETEKSRIRRQHEFEDFQKKQNLQKKKPPTLRAKSMPVSLKSPKSRNSFSSKKTVDIQYTIEDEPEDEKEQDIQEQDEEESEELEQEEQSTNSIVSPRSKKIVRTYWVLYKMAMVEW